MKNITIVFTKSKKRLALFSIGIMKYTNKGYSHVARECQMSFLEKPHYYQSNEGKVNYEYSTFFNKNHEIVKSYTFLVPEELYLSMVTESWKQVGEDYGILQNLGILIVDGLFKIGITINNPFKKGMNCSELIYRTVFLKMFKNLRYNPDTIKPHEIEEIIIDRNLCDRTDNN